MLAAAALSLVLVVPMTVVAGPPAAKGTTLFEDPGDQPLHHDQCFLNSHEMGRRATDQVSPNDLDCWSHDGIAVRHEFVLQPWYGDDDGDADLTIWDKTHTVVLCSSNNAGDATDSCVVHGTEFVIEVDYFCCGDNNRIDYRLLMFH